MKTCSYPSVGRRLWGFLAVLLCAGLVLGFETGTTHAATKTRLVTSITWRHQMQRLAVPRTGCFTGSYPTIRWERVRCHAAPKIPLAPRDVPSAPARPIAHSGVVPPSAAGASPVEVVGDGNDYSAKIATGRISSATGSFPYISPGSTETGIDYANNKPEPNTFSLQLNTEFFTGSPACNGSSDPSSCLAWQQFVYSSTYDGVYMQYWLIRYDATCPKGWINYGSAGNNDCYSNSEGGPLAATAPTIATLKSVSMTGNVHASGEDSLVMEYGGNKVSAVGADSVVDIARSWTAAEFALLGDGDGTEAKFSAGTTLDVKTAVNNGAATAPVCDFEGFTAETNNLNIASAPALSRGPEPAIETRQTSAGGTKGCAAAAVDTISVTNPGHQTTKKGSYIKLQLKAKDSAKGQTFTWSASGLPAGLAINASSGLISGRPTKTGTYSASATAKDKTGASGVTKFTWTVTTP